MTHNLKLNPLPFSQIAAGRKTIELRLMDEKRKRIATGDTLVFTCTESGDTLTAEVLALHIFESFEALYRAMPLEKCGYLPHEVKDASPRDMEAYYPKEKQALYGVVGIEIALK